MVLGILGILVSIVLVAINPLSQLEFAQNAKRKSYILTIGNGSTQYLIKHGEEPVAGIPSGIANAKPICRPGVTDVSCLNIDTIVPVFIAELPIDVAETSTVVTGYRIYKQGFAFAVCNDYLPAGSSNTCTGAGGGGGGGGTSSSVASSAGASSLAASSVASSAAASSAAASSSAASSEAASSSEASSSAATSSVGMSVAASAVPSSESSSVSSPSELITAACGTAMPIVGSMGTITTIFSGASEPGESCLTPGVFHPTQTFTWIADFSGTATFSLCGGASFDTVLGVTTDACVDGTSIACANDTCGMQSSVTFSATAATTYYINVSGVAGAADDFTMTWNLFP